MCGIVGLYLKNQSMQSNLGALFAPMLIEMTERGPDSAGFAIYRNQVAENQTKFTLASDNPQIAWKALDGDIEKALECDVRIEVKGDHAIVITDADVGAVTRWLAENRSDIRIVGSGRSIEIFKQTGLPKDVAEKFELAKAHGSHAIGHTRMATESAVTTQGSHPFATGLDLCLVHNGSLSNHNRLREQLQRHGIDFQTDNDSEVAAGYLMWQLHQGATLEQALTSAISDLDGFYTFAVGTSNGFAVLRDPIACKPAVMAENDDWVAIASEFRAIAQLPGVEQATVWEPAPATVYSWGEG